MNQATSATRPFSVLACFDDTEAGGSPSSAGSAFRRVPSSELHMVYVTGGHPVGGGAGAARGANAHRT